MLRSSIRFSVLILFVAAVFMASALRTMSAPLASRLASLCGPCSLRRPRCSAMRVNN